jgi:hypothetical protein
MIDHVLVDRLVELYDPFLRVAEPLWKKEKWIPKIQKAKPEPYDQSLGSASTRWHAGRIKWFMDPAHKIDAIEIDNEWATYTPVGIVLTDGHHRLCAAVLLGLKKIPASYSGCIAMLRYLKGLRKTQPW